MTNKQKIAILNKLRKSVIYRKRIGMSACLCFCYRDVTGEFKGDSDLRKLGLVKPRKTFQGTTSWYEQYDYKTRIRKIDELIKRLSK